MASVWTRRTWLQRHLHMAAMVVSARRPRIIRGPAARRSRLPSATRARVAAQADHIESALPQGLAQQAVDAARSAGAQYADVRLTRTVGHSYEMQSDAYHFAADTERIGVGVRALANGAWGFASGAFWDVDTVATLARDAVTQAKTNAHVGAQAHGQAGRTIDVGSARAAVGTWMTPIKIDPFRVPVEEKLDHLQYWDEVAREHHIYFPPLWPCTLQFIRQERVVATSEGTFVTQTIYLSGGAIVATNGRGAVGSQQTATVQGLNYAGQGWEMILDAQIPEQLAMMPGQWEHHQALGSKPVTIGKYTIVCDGATMASLLNVTLGVATQLDRALGYEANASGTSVIDDPLAMVGQFRIAAPQVTVTANRSAPTQLATVKWDDEGIEPQPFTLIKDGVLVDFQTTREQAAWLAPYYHAHNRPVTSHGCANSEDALMLPLQMMPNLTLEPGAAAVRLEDLVSNVTHGVLITQGEARADFQGRSGRIEGAMREITNGRLGRSLVGGVVQFDTINCWKNLVALGGPATTSVIPDCDTEALFLGGYGYQKGEPSQRTSYSVQAAAATIADQLIVRG